MLQNFGQGGKAKEFLTRGGATYLIMKFPDNSIAVLRRVRDNGTKGAAAAYMRLEASQMEVLRRLGARGGTTYQMGVDLLE